MQKVSLQFSSLVELWAFKRVSGASEVIVRVTQCLLIGSFSSDAIEKACRQFKATVVQTTTEPLPYAFAHQ